MGIIESNRDVNLQAQGIVHFTMMTNVIIRIQFTSVVIRKCYAGQKNELGISLLRFMSVYIRKRSSGLCLEALGSWTPDPARAYRFKTVQAAKEFCRYHNIVEVMILDESPTGSPEPDTPKRKTVRRGAE